jgi:hypothetical protein
VLAAGRARDEAETRTLTALRSGARTIDLARAKVTTPSGPGESGPSLTDTRQP